MNISQVNTISIVPDNSFNFSVALLSGKSFYLGKEEKVECSDDLTQKALIMSQHNLYAICKLPAPSTLGSVFHVYNETSSRSLIILLTHMNRCVSFDTFQRHLTSICEEMIEEENNNGIFIPPAVKDCDFLHFAINNVDWHERTPEGSTFHAMTTNVYGYDTKMQPIVEVTDHEKINTKSDPPHHLLLSLEFGDIPALSTTKLGRRSLVASTSSGITPHYLCLPDRRKARSLENVSPTDIFNGGNPYFHQMTMAWQLCRMAPTKLLELHIQSTPSWTMFFTKLSPLDPATHIGYGPMIQTWTIWSDPCLYTKD